MRGGAYDRETRLEDVRVEDAVLIDTPNDTLRGVVRAVGHAGIFVYRTNGRWAGTKGWYHPTRIRVTDRRSPEGK